MLWHILECFKRLGSSNLFDYSMLAKKIYYTIQYIILIRLIIHAVLILKYLNFISFRLIFISYPFIIPAVKL